MTRNQRKFVVMKLPRDFAFGPPQGWAGVFSHQPTFLEFRRDIKRLARDSRIEGVLITGQVPTAGLARLTDFSDMIGSLKEDGKYLVVHAQMVTLREYAALAIADEFLMTPAGRLYLFGARMDQYFAMDALERVGIQAQAVHIGPFKTAYHRFIHKTMTAPQELMTRHLFEGIEGLVSRRVESHRPLEKPLNMLLDKMPVDTRDAMRLGLIDGEAFRQDLANYLLEGEDSTLTTTEQNVAQPEGRVKDNKSNGPGKKRVVKTYEMARYMRSSPPPLELVPFFRARKRLAVMDLSGMIVMPDMNIPGQGSAAIDPEEVIPKLKAIARDPRIRGLLLHINSPGGSALASDILWRAIEDVRRKKPVVAFMSDVAASGGYYLAVAADQIVCRPETITGSIGVIAGKISAGEALKKVGIGVESIYDRESALFTSLVHPMPDSVMVSLKDDARSFYRTFLQRVGRARGLSRRRLHRYARGRVYLGEDALRRGLVDQLGGFDDAVELLAKLSGMDPRDAPLRYIPHRRQTLRTMVRQNVVANFSPLAGEVDQAITVAALLRREPVLAMMPSRIEI